VSAKRPPAPTTTTASVEVADARVSVKKLSVVSSPGTVSRQTLLLDPKATVTIGREPDSEPSIAVADRELSRRHAAIEAEDSGFCVVDLDSRNGTIVDGARIDRCRLADGAVIRVGKTLLLYQELELLTAEPLAAETERLRGPSLAMQRVRAEIGLVAKEPVPVLVLGESGVGKERVAESLHAESGRHGPLVSVNCASLSPELAESELFGHAQGAFTGAARRTEGLFASADGGTLFLDEIGELPPLVQPKLLRALATGEVRAVGSNDTKKVSVRIVAATHKDLEKAMNEGSFRGDLFARLAAWTIRVPPLRERKDDVLPLANAFLERSGSKLSTDAAEALLLHRFPFNVRELEQFLAAAAVRAATANGIVRLEHLPDVIGQAVRGRAGRASSLPIDDVAAPPLEALVARDAVPTGAELRLALERFEGNIAQVAAFFGKDRQQIYRWAKRYDVDLDGYR
jgi:transcriptional regulator with GAF, ATPase, and Fis domain